MVRKKPHRSPSKVAAEVARQRATHQRIDAEVRLLSGKRAATSDMSERAMLRAEIVHLQALRESLRSGRGAAGKRKPPEAGLSVPATLPKGPLPKQGGAAAPLDFDAD